MPIRTPRVSGRMIVNGAIRCASRPTRCPTAPLPAPIRNLPQRVIAGPAPRSPAGRVLLVIAARSE